MGTYKELIVGLAVAMVAVFLLLAGMMGIVTVYENQRAEQAKERCLEAHGNPVPWGNTYWCR